MRSLDYRPGGLDAQARRLARMECRRRCDGLRPGQKVLFGLPATEPARRDFYDAVTTAAFALLGRNRVAVSIAEGAILVMTLLPPAGGAA